jgi:uncharacterized protein YjbJ (UPF0337 family)
MWVFAPQLPIVARLQGVRLPRQARNWRDRYESCRSHSMASTRFQPWARGAEKEVLAMGNEQQNEGNLEQARGNIKEGVGDAIGNDQMKREGQMDQAKGQVREGVGDVREGVDKAADDWNKDH